MSTPFFNFFDFFVTIHGRLLWWFTTDALVRIPSNRRLLASKMRQTRVSAVGLRSDWGGAVNSNIFLFKRESSGLQPPLFELILRQRLVVEEALDHVYVHAFQYILLSVPLDAFYHDIQVHGIGKLRHRAHESI